MKLAKTTQNADKILGAVLAISDKRRLSMKVSAEMYRTVGRLMQTTNLSKTDLIKGVVAQIKQDIVEPDHPAHLKELQTLAMLTGC
jgi:hypothetical protein